MNKKISKLLWGVSMFFMILTLIYVAMIIKTGDDNIQSSTDLQRKILDPLFYLMYITFFISTAGAILFPIFHFFYNPKQGLKALAGILALAIVFIIAYSLSDNEILPSYVELGVTDPLVSKLSGAGLYVFYILFVIAILSAIALEISKMFK